MSDTYEYSWFYLAHIRSDEWKRRRLIMIAKAGSRCQRCGKFKKRGLQLHHLHYRNLGFEHDEDLQVLCYDCHKEADAERRELRFAHRAMRSETMPASSSA